jgi:hypothetical protein
MDSTVRSEQFESRMPFLRARSPDKEFGLDELEPEEADLALHRTSEEDPRRFPGFSCRDFMCRHGGPRRRACLGLAQRRCSSLV